MADYEVFISVPEPDDPEPLLEKLRAFSLPGVERFVEDEEDGPRFQFDSESADAALARGLILIRGATDGTNIDPNRVVLSVSERPPGA